MGGIMRRGMMGFRQDGKVVGPAAGGLFLHLKGRQACGKALIYVIVLGDRQVPEIGVHRGYKVSAKFMKNRRRKCLS